MHRPSPLVSSILLAGVCLSLGAPRATAQPAAAQPAARKPATAKSRDEARKHFQSAEAAKARADYPAAAAEYLAAYELFAEPAFYYDAAEVYRLAGDDQDALTYYTKYLELDPGGRGSAAARTAIDELRRSIAAKDEAARRAADDDAKRKAAAATPVAAPGTTAAATPTTPADTAAHDAAAGRNLRIAGLASGGVGVVAIGVGIAFGLKARSISNEAAHWDTFQPQRDADGKAANRDMYIFAGVGAAGLVAGGVLYYLGMRADRPADAGGVALAPQLGRSAIALTATGSF